MTSGARAWGVGRIRRTVRQAQGTLFEDAAAERAASCIHHKVNQQSKSQERLIKMMRSFG
jgi:hypothetical protein